MALYNRQYWFRFVGCMQEDYPCAERLLGVEAFNDWAMRFLETHPSDSPYLADLDRGFGNFMQEVYDGGDRALILEAIGYDKAFDQAFDSPSGTPLKLESLVASAANIRLVLAPHASPLWLHYDLGTFRRASSETISRPNPKEHGILIYRSQNTLYEKEVSLSAHLLLKELVQPKTLTELFESLESTASKKTLGEIEENLTDWFHDWVELGWICAAETPESENSGVC